MENGWDGNGSGKNAEAEIDGDTLKFNDFTSGILKEDDLAGIVNSKHASKSALGGQYVWYIITHDGKYVYWRLYQFNTNGTALDSAELMQNGSTYHIIENKEYSGSAKYISPS